MNKCFCIKDISLEHKKFRKDHFYDCSHIFVDPNNNLFTRVYMSVEQNLYMEFPIGNKIKRYEDGIAASWYYYEFSGVFMTIEEYRNNRISQLIDE